MRYIEKNKRMFIIGIIVLCAVMMLYSVYARTRPGPAENAAAAVFIPFQRAFSGVTEWFAARADFFRNIGQAVLENQELKEEIALLQVENERLAGIEREYAKLAELLNTAEAYTGFTYMGAKVIGRDPGLWYDNFIIDKGRRDGVDANMVIIAKGGLVGRVIETGWNYSKVRTLMDDTLSVSAKSARTDELGVVKGDLMLRRYGLCVMERINAHADILPGDEIITSNLGNIYPPGIIIGVVREININPDGLTKTAVIETQVDFTHLDVLLIITEIYNTELLDEDPGAVQEEEIE